MMSRRWTFVLTSLLAVNKWCTAFSAVGSNAGDVSHLSTNCKADKRAAFISGCEFASSSSSSSAVRHRFAPMALNMASGEELSVPYNKVFVAGGTRGVGRLIVEKLVGAGVSVVAISRSAEGSEQLEKLSPLISSPVVDAFDYKAVETAMDGCNAAISTLGQGGVKSADGSDKKVDYEGNSNVIEAAGVLGVTRVVLVTSIGCGNSKEAAPPSVFEVLKDVLKAKERAENLLIKYYTNSDWTIIRPGGLKSEPATKSAILTADVTKAIGTIHREDVAILVVKALASGKTTRKILSAVDPSISTSMTYTEESGNVEAFEL